MRLISAHIRGYGRLVDAKINLDTKVIAIIGPNEAGKTTLLKALTHVESGDALPIPQRSRSGTVDDNTSITTLEYVLDDSDREALADLDLHEQPLRARISRSASGDRLTVDIKPRPAKSVVPLQNSIAILKPVFESGNLGDWIAPDTAYADPHSDGARDHQTELRAVLDSVDAAIDQPGKEVDEEVVEFAESLLEAIIEDVDAEQVRQALNIVVDWANRKEPGQAARTRIWNRSPDFIMFNEADRSIQSAYTFDDAVVANPPVALQNLASTASLDLPELLSYVKSGDVARRRTALVQANSRMDEIFLAAWKQSSLSVHFEIDGDQLRIELMEGRDQVTIFDERSAGLRMFVALIAFLKTHISDRPPILLIDEAENHLHIDAQADLVNMFVTQEEAVKVLYTTHSPACLPPDLGTGIRSVVPRADNSQISDIKNSFWQGAAGYSPLLLAMGAAAVAFTPARKVVLSEGATEMLLLPTLIRSATSEPQLSYQVAPGLSEVPKDLLSKLDLEAARVVYLVDDDDGGAALRSSLLDVGIPGALILDIGVPGIENLLDPEAYCNAVNTLLPECNAACSMDLMPELPAMDMPHAGSWARFATTWAEENGLKVPSKVAVANWLVENQQAKPSTDGADLLRSLHQRILKALDRAEP